VRERDAGVHQVEHHVYALNRLVRRGIGDHAGHDCCRIVRQPAAINGGFFR
jgi:hypothetical protein